MILVLKMFVVAYINSRSRHRMTEAKHVIMLGTIVMMGLS